VPDPEDVPRKPHGGRREASQREMATSHAARPGLTIPELTCSPSGERVWEQHRRRSRPRPTACQSRLAWSAAARRYTSWRACGHLNL